MLSKLVNGCITVLICLSLINPIVFPLNIFLEISMVFSIMIAYSFDIYTALLLTILFIIVNLTNHNSKTIKKILTKSLNTKEKLSKTYTKNLDENKNNSNNHPKKNNNDTLVNITKQCNNYPDDEILNTFKTSKSQLNDIQNNVFDKYNMKVQYNELGANSLNMQGLYDDMTGYENSIY